MNSLDEFEAMEKEENEKLKQKTNENKSIEQVQAENQLDNVIPDTNEQAAQIEPTLSSNAADNLFGLFCLMPIALQFSGLKNTASVWDEKNCRGLSEACIPVFRKYAWGGKIINFLETGAGIEEMALFAVCMPLAIATHSAFKKDTYTPPVDEASVLTPNPARPFGGGGIKLASADDVDYDTRN